LIAGAVEFLDFLKGEGVDFTIATGSEYSNVDFYFDKFELGKWFDRSRVVLDDGTFPGKPAPDGYLRAAKVLGRDPADCVVFEDAEPGIQAAIAGGMGLAAGANLNPERKFPSMFEPIHGSAPDIAGTQTANPLAAIWSASQLLDFFGHEDLGRKILDTMEEMLTDHRESLTPDQGGNATTSACGDAFVELLKK
jgi:beta-phosphoglucomutase-like phosphatase (HAD superfamily)